MSRRARAKAVLAAEWDAMKRTDPDVHARDLADFAGPLLLRALMITVVSVIPLIVVRMGDGADDLFVPVIASFALAAVCTAVITWLVAIVMSALITMVLYRKPAATTSKLVVELSTDSFRRITDGTSVLMMLALVGGLVALGVGLPARRNADLAHSVIDDLLTSQIAILLGVLAIAFVAEAIRVAADMTDDQSPLLAWPWALIIVTTSWVLASAAGPLEITSIVRKLLVEWLPAMVNDEPQAQVIDALIPHDARWWASFGAIPVLVLIWWIQRRRMGVGPETPVLDEYSGLDGTGLDGNSTV